MIVPSQQSEFWVSGYSIWDPNLPQIRTIQKSCRRQFLPPSQNVNHVMSDGPYIKPGDWFCTLTNISPRNYGSRRKLALRLCSCTIREVSERIWSVEVEPLSVLSVAYCTVVANQSIYLSLSVFLCPRPVYSTFVTAPGNPGLHVGTGLIHFLQRKLRHCAVFLCHCLDFFFNFNVISIHYW